MSHLKSKEEGFSELISNPTGIPVKRSCSNEIRKEHNRWKNKVQQIKKDKLSKLSYWQIISSCAAL